MEIAVWHNLPSGGGQRAMYDHLRGLVERGHRIEIWAPPSADRSMLDLGQLAPYHEVPCGSRVQATLRNVPYAAGLMSPAKARAMRTHCREVGRQITRGTFDLLFCGTCLQFATSPLPRYVDLPSVLYLHQPNRPFYESPSIWRSRSLGANPISWARKVYDAIGTHQRRDLVANEIDNAGRFHTILVNSLFSSEAVARAYDITSRVCYLGIDSDLWVPERQPRGPIVVGIGEFTANKKIEFVIQAIADIPVPRPALRWIGNRADKQYLERLKQEARDLGIEFEPLVALSHDAMLKVLGAASVFAYAPKLEPFGYAPLEGGAAGLPTVAVAEGGVRETVIDGVTGILVSRDEHLMGKAISHLIDDEKLARTLGEAAAKGVREHWSLEAAVDRLEGELERVALVGSKPPIRQLS